MGDQVHVPDAHCGVSNVYIHLKSLQRIFLLTGHVYFCDTLSPPAGCLVMVTQVVHNLAHNSANLVNQRPPHSGQTTMYAY